MVLLEVLVAVTIFVFAAAVVGSAMRSSMQAVADIRLDSQAANLAQSVLAELSIGLLEMVETSGTPLAEDDSWTYEIAAEDLPDAPGLKQVTVTVSDNDPRRPHACRVTQWMLDPNFQPSELTEPADFEELPP